jgi:Calx-beta domain/HYR domain
MTIPTITLSAPATIVEGDTGSPFILAQVSLSDPAPAGNTTVHFFTTDGTASSVGSADYTATDVALTFLAGASGPATIAIPITADQIFEPDETLSLHLDSAVNGTIVTGDATVTILNDDAPLIATLAAPPTIVEGTGGSNLFLPTITLSRPAPTTVSLQFTTVDGTASSAGNADFTPQNVTLTFLTGATGPATIAIPITTDDVFEPDETMSLHLSALSGIDGIVNNDQSVTILNDDTPLVATLAAPPTIVEGTGGTNFLFATVTLSRPSSSSVSLQFTTVDGTASSVGNDDFTPQDVTLIFLPGAVGPATITIPITTDAVLEPNETFSIHLHALSGIDSVANNDAVVTILNDEPDPIPPFLHLPADITTQATQASGAASAPVTFAASAFDNVDGNLPVTFHDGATIVHSGDAFSLGTHIITASATDAQSNTALGAFRIEVDPLHLNGTPGDDSFTALPGSEIIDALGGNDTISFNFRLVDAQISFVGNKVIVDGPGGSHTVLTGFEIYQFTDGTVDQRDSDPLVDDLFYYSQNHDVWLAHAEADAHYHTFGRFEGRDPDAFFSTSTYLSENPDVKAAGLDPLLHFDQSGWREGRDPSILFDPQKYLAANPDVQAAGADPLAHFLVFGEGELRQAIAPSVLLSANAFDYVYYLQHNPDVAAAHVDPLLHYETVGWKEGRNPNAFFDTAGYLAHYADAVAANINPLDHYNQTGWREGHDPSVNFDTQHYLTANPDVAAAHVNPLLHFLQFGQAEGRSSFADGAFA